ncbi:MAG TPA: ABC transporter permease, partial [Planctomycetota bacterium]|nr:ABC transporter permease [Planctomycetota bacterium]
SVIAMLSIGEGASYEAQEEIKKLGSQNVILRSLKVLEQTGSAANQDVVSYGLKWKDYERMQSTMPHCRFIVPMRVIPTEARFGRRALEAQVVGTTPEYHDLGNVSLARGRFLSSNDRDYLRPVAVLGAGIARALFPAVDPIGQEIRLGQFYFTVVGTLAETGGASGTGGSQADDRNRDVYVPLESLNARFGELIVHVETGTRTMENVQLHSIIVSLVDDRYVSAAAADLEALLKRYHRVADYQVIVPLELLRQRERTKQIFNIVLGSIAAISLLVGGIGIMNIMLASITERTREIGIRRALGAKRRDIVLQFLVETVVLSTSGGLLGIVVGVAIPWIVEASTKMPTIITGTSLVVSFGISVAVGVIFGIYPANRAASMDPIEALRRE